MLYSTPLYICICICLHLCTPRPLEWITVLYPAARLPTPSSNGGTSQRSNPSRSTRLATDNIPAPGRIIPWCYISLHSSSCPREGARDGSFATKLNRPHNLRPSIGLCYEPLPSTDRCRPSICHGMAYPDPVLSCPSLPHTLLPVPCPRYSKGMPVVGGAELITSHLHLRTPQAQLTYPTRMASLNLARTAVHSKPI